MTTLHPSLRAKLKLLANDGVHFDAERLCFVHKGERKRGLTKILAALLPIPRSRKLPAAADESASNEAGVMRSTKTFIGRTLARCASCAEALTWAKQEAASHVRKRLEVERDRDCLHGLVIDYQLGLYVRYGRKVLFVKCPAVDPCVGSIIEQLDGDGWCAIASQVPIYDTVTDVATAVDILATDRGTRSAFYLIEIKASLRDGGADDYERTRGVIKRSILRDLPQSYYARHQMQLLCMNDTIERQFSFRPDRSVIMRVAPGTVTTYPLSPIFLQRRADVTGALAAFAAKGMRARKKKRTTIDAVAKDKKKRRLKDTV